MMPTAETVDVVELIWFGANLIGLLMACVGLGVTTGNLRAARRARRLVGTDNRFDGLHADLADQDVRAGTVVMAVLTIKASVMVLAVLAGWLNLLVPRAPTSYTVDGLSVRLATITVLIYGALALSVTSALLTAGSILARRGRHRLLNLIAARVLRQNVADRARASRSRASGLEGQT